CRNRSRTIRTRDSMSETETPDTRAEEETVARPDPPDAPAGDDGHAGPAPEPAPEEKRPRGGRAALIVAIVALILALLAIAGVVVGWYLGSHTIDRVTTRAGSLQQRLDRQASAVD